MNESKLKNGIWMALAFLLCGCVPVVIPASSTPVPLPTLTETSIPMAILVNGEGITQAELEAEIARFQLAQEELGFTTSLEEAVNIVRDDLVDQVLMAQDAAANGYLVDDAALQVRVDSLAAALGGTGMLSTWETDHGYTHEEFLFSLRRQMSVAWTRDRIIAAVPKTSEQVHVKQILFYNEQDAQNVYALLQSGWEFNGLAGQYNPVTRGELGWFPRGYLHEQSIEDAAFALQPGEYSAVVQSMAGYHLLYLVERDPGRLLSPDALLTMQEHALEDWLTQKRNESTIVITP